MDIRVGYRIEIVTAQPTPGVLLLDPHPNRDTDVTDGPRQVVAALSDGSPVTVLEYTDSFGNRCRRFVAPAGGAVFANE